MCGRRRRCDAWRVPTLADRSPWVTGCAFILAVIALTATAFYLRPLELGTWPNLVMALIALATPLVGRPPLTVQRLLICAAVWVGLGMPGGYVFGTPVFYAGCLLSVAVAARLFLDRRRAAANL